MNDSRYLPHGVKAKPKRPVGVLLLKAERCEKCGDPLPEAKYHDCGEQMDLFDTSGDD